MNILICGFGVFGRKHAKLGRKLLSTVSFLWLIGTQKCERQLSRRVVISRMSAILKTLFPGRISLIL